MSLIKNYIEVLSCLQYSGYMQWYIYKFRKNLDNALSYNLILAILNVNVTVVELLLNNKAETYFKFLNIHALHFACLVRNRDKLLKMEEEHKDVYSFAGSNKLHISIGIHLNQVSLISIQLYNNRSTI